MRKAAVAIALLLVVNEVDAAAAAGWSDDRAIFTAEAAREKWVVFSGSTATAFWTPALADVLALEQRLPDYIRRELGRERGQLKRKQPLWERAKTYKRQYVGGRQKERRFVFANFFCNDFGKSWRTEPIFVKDGGDCYFSVQYDVDKRTFSQLLINGEA